jgi:SRSO17 transposase
MAGRSLNTPGKPVWTRMQRLLSQAVWDEDGVRDDVRTLVCQSLHPPSLLPAPAPNMQVFPVRVIDESGMPKRGRNVAGAASQYCGASGQVENCQVGVFLSLVSELGHAIIDRELYLPEDWCDDLPRRQAAHIPETLTFQTKPELAIGMLKRGQAICLPLGWVVGDTVYGHSPTLRTWLEEQGYSYALAVPCTEVVCVQSRAGLLLSDVASIAQQALRARDWQRLSQSQGTQSASASLTGLACLL